MKSNNPKIIGGLVYDKLALYLAVSPNLASERLSASVSLTFYPARENDMGLTEVLTEPSYVQSINIVDVFASDDQEILTCLYKVDMAIQELVNKKGL